MSVTIYHNPRCSKSRQTLQLLRGAGVEPEIIDYLDNPPTARELDRILGLLGIEPRQLMRRKESTYKDAGLDDESLSRGALIDAMVANPILIARPIVVKGDTAVLGRPPDNVLALV